MKKHFKSLRNRFSRRTTPATEGPLLDTGAEIEVIKRIEAAQDPGLGRVIHHFPYLEFDLWLDRDITGTYRVVVYQGKKRRYSFSIQCGHKDYEALRNGFEEIICFLGGNRRIVDLPKNKHLKGHYFGG
jgi:hypothetical protein